MAPIFYRWNDRIRTEQWAQAPVISNIRFSGASGYVFYKLMKQIKTLPEGYRIILNSTRIYLYFPRLVCADFVYEVITGLIPRISNWNVPADRATFFLIGNIDTIVGTPEARSRAVAAIWERVFGSWSARSKNIQDVPNHERENIYRGWGR